MSGLLIYVMGPSGAGKDTILQAARKQLQGESVVFAHRYITRPASAGGENHVALAMREFEMLHTVDAFALSWHSHGNAYGIGREIDHWLAQGLVVIMNGSRAYLPQARMRYPHLLPVLITAPREVLAKRLACRGRECHGNVIQRLTRNESLDQSPPQEGAVIFNTGTVDSAVQQFLALLHPYIFYKTALCTPGHTKP